MGQRGPKPRPTLKLIGGENVAVFSPGTPSCPSWLGKAARACWRRTMKELAAAGVLTAADGDALAVYCQCVADLEKLSAEIGRDGMMLDSPTFDLNGKPTGATARKVNPALRVRDQLVNRVRQLAGEFGLTPASRSRAAVVAAPTQGKPVNKVQEIAERIKAARAGIGG